MGALIGLVVQLVIMAIGLMIALVMLTVRLMIVLAAAIVGAINRKRR